MQPNYKGNCPYVPTKDRWIKIAFILLDIHKRDNVLDMGSGDGKFLIYSAKRSEAKFTGVEINKFLIFISKFKVLFTGAKKRIKILEGNFYNIELSSFNKIFIFGMPSLIKKLLPKLEEEIVVGTKIVSIRYPILSNCFKQLRVVSEKGEPVAFLYEKILA